MIGRDKQPSTLWTLVQAIVAGDTALASRIIGSAPEAARTRFEEGGTRQNAKAYFISEFGRQVYAGDTPLHVAAAAYRTDLVQPLLAAGADVRAKNRRGAEPLHSASVGTPGSTAWNPAAQAATIVALIEAGADPNAVDASGVTPLHRAVRTRCAAAVKALLDNGADPRLRNGRGSTPGQLAGLNTGRGGTGSPEAKREQRDILHLLAQHGAGSGRP